ENYSLSFLSETDSPFRTTFEMPEPGSVALTPAAEAFTELLAELNDPEFETTLYNLAAEAEETFSSKISNEAAMGEQYIPYAKQQINQYLNPLAQETERIIDKISEHFSGINLSDETEAHVDQLFEKFESDHVPLSPAQEQFFGSIFNKIKSAVKTGINLAKKGISAVGKILPVNIILGKIKGLVRPLLEKVLKFAINKLPKKFQPYAQTLAKKFLNLETGASNQTEETINSTSGDLESIQSELDSHIANLMFSPDESQSNELVQNYLFSSETVEKELAYETGGISTPTLESARQKFINDLKNLKDGESAVPAIENFLPAVYAGIKIAISLIGRQRVIDFLAGLLSKLVEKYIPKEVAKPLSDKIVDVGLAAVGFETYEAGRTDLAYEAIANTIEETIQNLGELDETAVDDREQLTSLTLEAFETAAVNNFPSSYIKETLRKTKQQGLWVLMPRNGPRHFYKKFTHVFPITIEPSAANTITSFKGVPLSNFLRDKLGLDPSKPIQARVHLYEAIEGTKLNRISRSENVTGLGPSQPYGWVQFHPLSVNAATLLLNEPGLGKDLPEEFTKNRHRLGLGQRVFYLEINGARLKLPTIQHRKRHEVPESAEKEKTTVPRSSDIQGVINFIRSEIKFNYYFSEEDAKSIVEKLNQNDYLGVSIKIRNSVRKVLNDLLIKNVCHKVKIIHEAMPELYIDNVSEENFTPWESVKSMVLNTGKEILKKIIEKIMAKISEPAYKAVLTYFKTRAAEFKHAQSLPDDGVTVKIMWLNVPGMSAIRAVIKAVKGNLSLGKISDLSIPNIPVPEIKIAAGKIFD
ncbi:MAG TPA: hypothetical protein VMT35_07870, partial [Ignavibacteriaceae bacterium]|nr:hypothetical protein [Ignavibacteriaceae bacterium]